MPDDRQRLTGRVAIVTGAGGGIGRAEALLLAEQGAAVVVNDIAQDSDGSYLADAVVEEIRGTGGRAEAHHGSVADASSARGLVEAARDAFGGLDILVNNAGVVTVGLVESLTEEEWDRVVGTHLRGTFLMVKYAVPGFKRQRSGVIVNTSSESGLGHPTKSHYAAAKEGIVGLTRTVAREVGGSGVRCNAIRPRAVGTSGVQGHASASAQWRAQLEQLGRFRLGERGHVGATFGPEHVAPMVVWLCTDAAANVNGCTFAVEGNLVGIWSEPALARSIVRSEGWDLTSLDETVPQSLTFDLENRFIVEL